MAGTGSHKRGSNLRWGPGHQIHDTPARLSNRQIDWAMTQHDHSLVSVIPLAEGQNFLKRPPSHDDRINTGNELIVAMLCAVTAAIPHQPVEIAVRPRDESVETDAYKDRALWQSLICFHPITLCFLSRHTTRRMRFFNPLIEDRMSRFFP